MVAKKKLNHHVIFKTMRISFLFLIVISIAFNVNAQSRIEKLANEDYSTFNFSKAIARFQKVDPKNIEIWRKLAYSNEVLGKYKDAEFCWKKVAESGYASGEDMYQYAQSLKYSKKYNESQEWLKKANEKLDKDTRVQRNLNLEQGDYTELQKDKGNASVKHLSMNSEDQDFGPTIMGEQVVFASTRAIESPISRIWNWNGLPFLELYAADVLPNHDLGNIHPFQKRMKGKYHEGPASFNKNLDFVMFTRNNYGGRDKTGARGLQLYSSTKDEKGKWSKPAGINLNSSDYSVGHPSLTSDGKIMYFVSEMPGGIGGTDIYKSVLAANGTWSKPENLGKAINTEGNEMFPFYHESGLLYFASDGHQGLGGLDNFVAKLGEDGSVQDIINLGFPVNSSFDDFSIVFKSDMKSGYFASNRNGGSGNDDIYAVNVLKMWEFEKPITLIVKDSKGNLIGKQDIALNLGESTMMVTTSDDGKVTVDALTWKNVVALAERKTFFNSEVKFAANEMKKGDVVEIVMNPLPIFDVVGCVTDNSNNQPLSNVAIEWVNKKTGEVKKFTTNDKGEFNELLTKNVWTDTISYKVILSKNGYLSKVVSYDHILVEDGKVSVNKEANLAMEPLKVGADLGKLVQVNPIYFDLGKYEIRPDAAVELDKIVDLMNANPTMVIELGSHTDCRSSKAFNLKLSDNRAKASAEYIKKRITDPKRIYGKGYGESKLVNQCECEGKKLSMVCSEEEHQANRRTEFKLIKI
jgi:outer membrane protein OmpA-like peptidoglycan-associated protein/tetratricopeptide (TPR) repeat protein